MIHSFILSKRLRPNADAGESLPARSTLGVCIFLSEAPLGPAYTELGAPSGRFGMQFLDPYRTQDMWGLISEDGALKGSSF